MGYFAGLEPVSRPGLGFFDPRGRTARQLEEDIGESQSEGEAALGSLEARHGCPLVHIPKVAQIETQHS